MLASAKKPIVEFFRLKISVNLGTESVTNRTHWFL